MTQERYIDIEKARQMLPLVKTIARDIKETYNKRIKIRESLNNLETKEDLLNFDLEITKDRLSRYFDELNQLGLEVRLEREEIIFPSKFMFRRIEIIYKAGDDSINSYYDIGINNKEIRMPISAIEEVLSTKL